MLRYISGRPIESDAFCTLSSDLSKTPLTGHGSSWGPPRVLACTHEGLLLTLLALGILSGLAVAVGDPLAEAAAGFKAKSRDLRHQLGDLAYAEFVPTITCPIYLQRVCEEEQMNKTCIQWFQITV